MCSTIASATDYYISSSGNDTNNGLSSSSPWKTIAKVNSAFSIITPGDRILFNRGDSFYGTITISKAGTAGAPIFIGAYGTGEKPLITGFTTISGWTNEGGGIYSKIIASSSQTNMVILDGVNKGMGRTPDAAYLTFETSNTNISVTDNQLGSSPNWKGAEAVIMKNDWTLDRCLITNHSGTTITYTSLGTLTNSSSTGSYFIQNDLRCVTNYGEWYHDVSTGKFYMYFGAVDPTSKTVKVATLNNLLINNGYNYITLDNISFAGSIKDIIAFNGNSSYCTIQNCSIDFSGNDGINLPTGCSYSVINNNSINHSSRSGVYLMKGTDNHITNNIINNSGIVPGSADIGSYQDGILFANQINGLVQYNSLDCSGSSGIYFTGNGSEIKNNFINHSVLLLKDGGGIYTVGAGDSGRIIDGNIVLNTGLSNTTTIGIYCDEYTANTEIINNTVANSIYSGFMFHKAHNNVIKNNTSFNNGRGVYFSNWSGSPAIYNNSMSGNIFISGTGTQLVLDAETNVDEIPSFGIFDNNYYSRPIDDNLTFFTYQPSEGYIYRSLEGWQKFTGQDANSRKSAISISDSTEIKIYYNATKTNKLITLDQPMIDVRGTKYFNSITLLAFTSAVLMVDPNPANQPPVVTISSPTKGDKYENPATITIDAVASDPDGSISKVEFYNGSVKLVELTSAPYEYTWKDVKAGTYSITAIATDNLNATSTSFPIEFEVVANSKYDVNSNIINLYPNPNDGHFSIEFINPLQNEKSEVVITDLAGKQVYNSIVSKEDIIKQIDLSYIKSGIYILFIIYKKILVTKKIIIN